MARCLAPRPVAIDQCSPWPEGLRTRNSTSPAGARCSGIAAQIVDERTVHRNGKGVAIYRPSDIPVNQPHRRLKKA